MDDFGVYLKKLRGKRSLRELSKATGISHTYLSTLEKGFDPRTNKQRKPTLDTINKLASALEVDRFELLEKAGLLDDETLSILNKVKGILKMEMHSATKEEVKSISDMQLEKATDLEIMLNPTEGVLLKYNGQLLTNQDKRSLLNLLKDLFNN